MTKETLQEHLDGVLAKLEAGVISPDVTSFKSHAKGVSVLRDQITVVATLKTGVTAEIDVTEWFAKRGK